MMGKDPHSSALLTAPHQPNIYHKAPLSPPTVPNVSHVAAILVSICIFTQLNNGDFYRETTKLFWLFHEPPARLFNHPLKIETF